MFVAGQSIGNYRILQKIGTGGMGAVYLAEHPLIGKRVALKVIHRELAGNKEVVQRFFQEARAVNKIGNEHIVEVHDFGMTPEGDHFYIMEYIDGRTLASVLTHDRAVEIRRALHVGAQIASALSAAHSSGIIHRDLKPDNIMLVPRLGDPDFVKVLDFGLAKMFQAQGASAVQTAAGVLLGTPQYMSPEACESKRDLDHRTDIYALGILLFQMMTGVLPFDGESMGEVLVKQVTQLPPVPRALNPSIPPSVEQILLRCLAKVPDARFPTMLALRDALLDPEAYLRGSPPIAAARSVAPGQAPADAAQVRAAAEARTRMMMKKESSGAGLPLPAPAPTLSGQKTLMFDGGAPMAPVARPAPVPGRPQPAETKMNTMRISTPVGYSSRPPRKVWPIVLGVGLVLGVGGGVFAVASFGNKDGPAETGTAGSGTPTNVGSAAAAATNTGSAAATNVGSAAATNTGSAAATNTGSAAPTNTGSAAATNTGSAAPTNTGSAAATNTGSAAATNTGSAAPTNTGSATTNAGSATANAGSATTNAGSAASTGAGSAASGSGASGPASKRVKVSLDSLPAGATVFGPDGEQLGKAPFTLDWPASPTPLKLVFKLRGYRDKTLELEVSQNAAARAELSKIRVATPPPTKRTEPPVKGMSGKDGLERPD